MENVHDRIRDWIEGRLAPEDALRLEREIEGSPELRAFADDYRAVHGMTTLVDTDVPAVRTRFEDLVLDEARAPRSFGLRRVAAAAAITLVTGAAALSVLDRRASATPLEL